MIKLNFKLLNKEQIILTINKLIVQNSYKEYKSNWLDMILKLNYLNPINYVKMFIKINLICKLKV